MGDENYVGKLNEYAQKRKLKPPFYDDLGFDGTRFSMQVVLDGTTFPVGLGRTKKDAKQKAAENAFKSLTDENLDSVSSGQNSAEASSAASTTQPSLKNNMYISWLNEYGQRNGVHAQPVESHKVGLNSVLQCCFFKIGDKKYPMGTGETKKEAKERAAKLAYDAIHCERNSETDDEKSSVTSNQQEEELNVTDERKSPTETTKVKAGTNFIAWLNNYCQETKQIHDYIVVDKCGPSHEPQFYYKVVIDKKDYPVAEGKSVKEAKQNAAQLVWSSFQEQSDFDRKSSLGSLASDKVARSSTPSPSSSENTSSSSIVFANSSSASDCRSYTASSKSSEGDTSSRESLSWSSSGMQGNTNSSGVFTDSNYSSVDEVAVLKKTPGVSQPETTPGSKFTSDFDSIEKISSGGYGCVFKARFKLLKKNCAVKIVCSELDALREVRTLSELQHTNIVRYYTCWEEDTGYQWEESVGRFLRSSKGRKGKFLYIHMELCDTKTLRDWIEEKNNHPLSDQKRRKESLDIARQILSGVEYIHSKTKIHRDLKPENILFGLDGTVKIGDFGLVTIDDALLERTSDRGTESYMAPEQFERSYDRKVDIFPLGLIYLELLWKLSTGHERFIVLQEARAQRLPEGFSQTFFGESRMILSMLSEKPEDRPEASALIKELEKLSYTRQESRTK